MLNNERIKIINNERIKNKIKNNVKQKDWFYDDSYFLHA